MNSKAEMAEIVRKYIEIREDSSKGKHARWARLKEGELKKLPLETSFQGIGRFSAYEVKCAHSSACLRAVYGYYPWGEMPVADHSNAIIPPLCGEHLLEAAETLDWLLVQALLSIDQKIMNKTPETEGPHTEDLLFAQHKSFRTDNRCWPLKPPGKAKNRME